MPKRSPELTDARMEENTSLDRLTDMKIIYSRLINIARGFVKKYSPQLTDEQLHEFICLFFPFMFGIYTYTMTDKQQAMTDIGMDYPKMTVYDMTYGCVKRLLDSGVRVKY